jgi:23S rRNA-/tRNA-specific pseudouridylate synthase
LRKPSNIASTPGKEMSIFDIVKKKDSAKLLQKSFDTRERQWATVGSNLWEEIKRYGEVTTFVSSFFDYSLLANRLDTPTSWYLLFTSSIPAREHFELDQKAESYQKYYLARVVGDIRYWIDKNPYSSIKLPIMHHQSLEDRMTCVQGGKHRWRGKIHQVTSSIEFLTFDPQSQTSVIKVSITKGIRHQIRVHCSAIGYPILGDELYGAPGKKTGELWLTSVGIEKKV